MKKNIFTFILFLNFFSCTSDNSSVMKCGVPKSAPIILPKESKACYAMKSSPITLSTDSKEKVLAYDTTFVMNRYKKEHEGVSDERLKILDIEFKKFALAGSVSTMPLPMFHKDLDEYWHTFILYTHEYKNFCKKLLGKFIHHTPAEKSEPATLEQKENLKNLYLELFNQEPNQEFWPLDENECVTCK